MSITRLERRLEKVKRLRNYALQDRNAVKAIQANHLIFRIQTEITNQVKPCRNSLTN